MGWVLPMKLIDECVVAPATTPPPCGSASSAAPRTRRGAEVWLTLAGQELRHAGQVLK